MSKITEALRSHTHSQTARLQEDWNNQKTKSTLRLISVLPLAATLAACGRPDYQPTATPPQHPEVAKPPATVDFDTQRIPTIASRDNSEKKEKSMKEHVLSFSWHDADNSEKLSQFTSYLADQYLLLTNTHRLQKEDLVGPNRTTFHNSRQEFTSSIKKAEPNFTPTIHQWGYTHYASKRVFIDLASLKQQSLTQTPIAGLAFLDALWHEWGHLDVVERRNGELINNPSQGYFFSSISKQNEPYKYYRGGAIYTDTYYGFLRFEEVWNETITIRRMMEQVGLQEVIAARDYYSTGVDFFPELTRSYGISLEELYTMHASSDFEGFAKRIGEKIPGPANERLTSLQKGRLLFLAIHNQDTSLLQALRVKLPR